LISTSLASGHTLVQSSTPQLQTLAIQTSTPSIQLQPHTQIEHSSSESDEVVSISSDNVSYVTISNEQILCFTVSSADNQPIATNFDGIANDEDALDASVIVLD
jgi:hypothetical protein